MDYLRQAFLSLPDTVIITDVYWYVLDYNRTFPFETLKKGDRLTRYMGDCAQFPDDEYTLGGRVFQRSITPVYENHSHVGYTVYLSDVTEWKQLIERQRQKSAELEELTRKQASANAELEEYARQAKALSEYTEQLRIARSIHDGAGHAITALHTISQMCLRLRDSDPEQYNSLLQEGISICQSAVQTDAPRQHTSLRELLESFQQESQLPIELSIHGTEPDFVAPLYETVYRICSEAYHNTLAHSLADTMFLETELTQTEFTLRFVDNGRFHGTFEKGFGLKTMEDAVLASGGSLTFQAEEGAGFGIIAKWRSEPCVRK